MKKLIYFTLLLGIIACKKDLLPPTTPQPPTTENPGSTDSGNDNPTSNDDRKVRIVRVEQTESPNSFPFDTDELMSVDYHYSDGALQGVNVWRGYSSNTYYNSSSDNEKYDFDVSADFANISLLSLMNITLNVENEKIVSGSNIFQVSLGNGPQYSRNINYTYNSTGNLTKITRSDLMLGVRGGEIQVENYDNGLVKNYKIENYLNGIQSSPKIGQEFEIQVSYQKADGVPKDLIRKINQAVLGLSPISFEDYYFQQEYDLLPESNFTRGDIKHAQKVAKYKYSFADWIISFGLTDAYSIPEQGNQLISSKHIQGKKFVDGKQASDYIITDAVYKDVDSTAQYTYVYHADEKMLEIAGLKIYYEWADEEEDTNDPESGIFIDTRDGEQYKVVTIGNQTWFAENLRYEGNIAEVTNDDDWRAIFLSKQNTPAWAYYENNSAYNQPYGKLYNWFAVNTGNLCPNGWHIPTNIEWLTLRNYLGGEGYAGDKMKSTTDDWKTPKTNATNESGFTGLPGGWRSIRTYPSFYSFGEIGYWWSSTPTPSSANTDAFYYGLAYNNSKLTELFQSRAVGLSCRCVKD
ncbi:MAG: fibrobacter succinogenes major paralogous domain-containing protein [Chitinophagales bacterium]|nr:fibrobacter succinogenes major paralogous domain-containing protein [Chitinophagales bacterium]MCZ2394428.1 fibrobacter succinogenes major paralogous domain-containing protein [Chitinophagales bacterium]